MMDEVTSCVHHFVLGDPKDGRIIGACKHCGGKRTWSAVLDLDREGRVAGRASAAAQRGLVEALTAKVLAGAG